MSTPIDQAPAEDADGFVPLPRRVAGREVGAVVLLAAGAGLLALVAFHVPWQVNVAGLAVILIAAGVALGMSR